MRSTGEDMRGKSNPEISEYAFAAVTTRSQTMVKSMFQRCVPTGSGAHDKSQKRCSQNKKEPRADRIKYRVFQNSIQLTHPYRAQTINLKCTLGVEFLLQKFHSFAE